MNRATPYELRAIADELKRLSGDTETLLCVEQTNEGHTSTHELYEHMLHLSDGRTLQIVGDFMVRWVKAKFTGDHLQPADPDTIEAIEGVNLYVARLYGSEGYTATIDNNKIERLANDRSRVQQRAAVSTSLDQLMSVPA